MFCTSNILGNQDSRQDSFVKCSFIPTPCLSCQLATAASRSKLHSFYFDYFTLQRLITIAMKQGHFFFLMEKKKKKAKSLEM